MLSSLHRHTPTVTASDPRGLHVRTARYLRREAEAPAQALVEHRSVDVTGRRTSARDARNVQVEFTQLSMSGAAVTARTADGGAVVTLHGVAAQPLMSWDARGWRQRVEHDDRLRPVARFEAPPGQAERCLERIAYGGPEASEANGCAAILRHDDGAGTETTESVSILGAATRQARRFLAGRDDPDWPESLPARDALLEGEGYPTLWIQDATGLPLLRRDARGNEQAIRYAIDGAPIGQLLRLADGATHEVARNVTYSPMPELLSSTAGNGVVSTATYDEATGRLSRMRATRTDGTPVQDIEYGYDPCGNLLFIRDGLPAGKIWRGTRGSGDRGYAYDTLYRLIEATGSESASATYGPDLPAYSDPGVLTPYTQVYEYDDSNNLLLLRQQGARPFTQRMVVAGDSNRSMHWPEGMPEPDMADSFDANGNQRILRGGKELRWNGRNELATVTLLTRSGAVNDEEFYRYAANGTRCRKTSTRLVQGRLQASEVRYLPGLELRSSAHTGEQTDVVNVEAPFGGAAVFTRRDPPPGEGTAPQIHYRLGDHLGSIAVELDAQARLIGTEGYYPFGGTAWRSAPNDVEADRRTRRYSGKERDASGLYYYGYRYYAPWQCRWTQPDPAGTADGPNLYLFVGNSPAGRRDPDGRVGEEASALLWAIVGFFAASAIGAVAYAIYAASRQREQEKLGLQWMNTSFQDYDLGPEERAALSTFVTTHATAGATHFVRSGPDRRNTIHVLALTESQNAEFDPKRLSPGSFGGFAKERGYPHAQVRIGHRISERSTDSSPDLAPSSSRRTSTASASSAFTIGSPVSVVGGRRGSDISLTPGPSLNRGGVGRTAIRVRRTPPPAEPTQVPLTHTPLFEEQLERLRNDPGLSAVLTRVERLLENFRTGTVPRETVFVPGLAKRTGSDTVPGFGHTGAGAYRLLTTGSQAGRTIEGIGDPHGPRGKGYVKPKWW